MKITLTLYSERGIVEMESGHTKDLFTLYEGLAILAAYAIKISEEVNLASDIAPHPETTRTNALTLMQHILQSQAHKKIRYATTVRCIMEADADDKEDSSL